MPSVSAEFWAEVDQRIANARACRTEAPALLRASLMPDTWASEPELAPERVREPEAQTDQERCVSPIDEVSAQAEAQSASMLAQERVLHQALQDLRHEAETIRHQVRLIEIQARYDRLAAERQVSRILAQAEAARQSAEAQAEEAPQTEDCHRRLEADMAALSPRRVRPRITRAA